MSRDAQTRFILKTQLSFKLGSAHDRVMLNEGQHSAITWNLPQMRLTAINPSLLGYGEVVLLQEMPVADVGLAGPPRLLYLASS